MQEGYIPPDRDDRFQDVHVYMSYGILGDRIEQIKIPRDSDRISSQTERHFRRNLEMPSFPDIVIVWFGFMSAATLFTSILIEIIKGGLDKRLMLITGIFAAIILIIPSCYCARAMSTQPHLKWGILYRCLAVLFGVILGAIND